MADFPCGCDRCCNGIFRLIEMDFAVDLVVDFCPELHLGEDGFCDLFRPCEGGSRRKRGENPHEHP